MIGIKVGDLDRNILVEIGLIVLDCLAAINAIRIVAFARQARHADLDRFEITAARTRLRLFLRPSCAFIFGAAPLALATGAETRQSTGTAVFAGMLGVTTFGLLFTPMIYVAARK